MDQLSDFITDNISLLQYVTTIISFAVTVPIARSCQSTLTAQTSRPNIFREIDFILITVTLQHAAETR